jgi:hypothetical protein
MGRNLLVRSSQAFQAVAFDQCDRSDGHILRIDRVEPAFQALSGNIVTAAHRRFDCVGDNHDSFTRGRLARSPCRDGFSGRPQASG